jgi:hypothetical protein
LAGLSFDKNGEWAVVVYDPRHGWHGWRDWRDLWDSTSSRPQKIAKLLVNDRGDCALGASSGVVLATESGGSLRPIPGPAGHEFTLEALGPDGEVVGSYRRQPRHQLDRGGKPRPFVYSPRRGFVDLLPDELTRGSAKWISTSGVIRGPAQRLRDRDTLFAWDPANGFTAVDLRAAYEATGKQPRFRWAEVIDVNERGDFIAQVRVTPRPRSRCLGLDKRELFVYYDPRQGFVDLQQAVDQSGLDLEIAKLVALNDHAQIVAHACRAGNTPPTGIVLTPR